MIHVDILVTPKTMPDGSPSVFFIAQAMDVAHGGASQDEAVGGVKALVLRDLNVFPDKVDFAVYDSIADLEARSN